jgi:hypothetical protein
MLCGSGQSWSLSPQRQNPQYAFKISSCETCMCVGARVALARAYDGSLHKNYFPREMGFSRTLCQCAENLSDLPTSID